MREREDVVDDCDDVRAVYLGEPVQLGLTRRMRVAPRRLPVLAEDPVDGRLVRAASNVEVTHRTPLPDGIEYPEPETCDR